MRKEIAFVIAETVSIIPGALISLLDNGRAQYGYALILAILPLYCLFITLIFLPIFTFIESKPSPKGKIYTLACLIIASTTFAFIWSVEAGLISALSGSISVGTAFLLASWLTRKQDA